MGRDGANEPYLSGDIMYLWVTTKCQQRCIHCCHKYALGKKSMSERVWKKALEFTFDRDSIVSLGGGEPLLHKDLEKIVFSALCNPNCEGVWFATNGLETERAIAFRHFADGYGGYKEPGRFSCSLSGDHYHQRPHDSVIEAFKGHMHNTTEPFSTSTFLGKEGCACPEYQILVNGKVKFCACENAPIVGDIWKGISITHQVEELMEEDDLRCWNEVDKAIKETAA